MSQLTPEQVDALAVWLDGQVGRDTTLSLDVRSALLATTARYRLLRTEHWFPANREQARGIAWVIARIGFIYAEQPGYIHAWRPEGW